MNGGDADYHMRSIIDGIKAYVRMTPEERKGRKKLKDRFTPKFSIKTKLSLSIGVLVVMLFALSMQVATVLHMLLSVAYTLQVDLAVEKVIAEYIDQEALVRVFEQGQAIYDSIPEEVLTSSDRSEYMKRYEVMVTPEYVRLRQQLGEIIDITGGKWVDLRILDEDKGRVIYLMNTTPDEDGKYDAGYWENEEDSAFTMYNSFDLETPDLSILDDSGASEDGGRSGFGSDEYEYYEATLWNLKVIQDSGVLEKGVFVSGSGIYHPETGKRLGYMGIGQTVESYRGEARAFRLIYVLTLLLVLVISIPIYRFIIGKLLVNPLRKLSRSARDYVVNRDDIQPGHYFEQVRINSRDEVRVLRDSMSEMEVALSKYVDNVTQMTAEKERMAAEMDLAARIQLGMLSGSLANFKGVQNFDVCASIKPAKEVGGDFYDFFAIDEDHIGLSIADVSGKGVPAALYMVVVRSLLKTAGVEAHTPRDAVRMVNDQMCENNPEMMFVTLWFGIYCVSERKVTYVNAGHEHPALYRCSTGKYELIREEHDVVLGFDTGVTFRERELILEPGDRLFLYTDGVPEATDAGLKMLGNEGMLRILNDARTYAGPQFLEAMRNGINDFIGDADQFDDITMLLLEIRV